mgnify:CR=1 FL=1
MEKFLGEWAKGGKLNPEFFPKVFGPKANQKLDFSIVDKKFTDLAKEISLKTKKTVHPSAVAEGFLSIAVESMSNAIKKISVQLPLSIPWKKR